MICRTLAKMSWRDQGITYVKYLNVCTEALHLCTIPKARAKYERFSNPNYSAYMPESTGGMQEITKVPIFTKDY
ncbi:unnamed protein product [Phytomonas sp. Hart1]|nr:unnamed protein product [Phytomonas sp. Hart1]|eukprot:CCW67077.1 unnamed protein product [Phytomonas sp. isolate Hart1]